MINPTDIVREQMVQQQVRAWDVLEERVLDTFRKVPRELFTPADQRFLAYADVEVPLPHGQHMLRPNVAGRLLQALELAGSEHVLEIGTGSGFLTGCLAVTCANVRSLEFFPDLAERARANLATLGVRNIEVIAADASQLEEQARYDALVLTASLPVYDERFEQLLNVGGRACLVVGDPPVMQAWRVRRVAEQAWARESLFETVIDPLINASRPSAFSF